MAPEQHAAAPAIQMRLPVLVFGVVEVRRLHRELEALEDFVRQSEIREPGKQAQLPRVSRLLDALATDNSLQLLQSQHRAELQRFLKVVATQAPKLHVSFAVDPSSAFTAKIVTWLRASIHPWALLEVGLQPTIAAGCVVRTSNKVFDFSLRERFTQSVAALMDSLEVIASQAGQDNALPAEATMSPPTTPAVVQQPAQVAPQAAVSVPAGTPEAVLLPPAATAPQEARA